MSSLEKLSVKVILGGRVQELEVPETPALASVCACGAALRRPAPASVASCDACRERSAREEQLKQRMRQIPARFAGVSLDSPISRDGRLVVPEAARAAARLWLAGAKSWLVLRGFTGAGKTTLAAAIALARAERGELDWISARRLYPQHPERERAELLFRRARASRFLILDGLGAELAGAPEGGGVLAQRAEWTAQVLGDRHEQGRERTVITVDLDDLQLRAAYGGGIERRLTEATSTIDVIDLDRCR